MNNNLISAAVLQMNTVSGDIEANLEEGFRLADEAVAKGAKLLIYPELSLTGYHLERRWFEGLAPLSSAYLDQFCAYAKDHGVAMAVPYVAQKEGNIYISLAFIERNGEILASYDKSFLWGVEQTRFTHGERRYQAFDTTLGRIGILICYDIEFSEPSRILALDGAQLIIVASVWSIPAQSRWDIQLPARALDNTVFVAGANTVGEGSCGKSKFVAPDGTVLCEASANDAQVLMCTLDPGMIDEVRTRIPYLNEYDMSLYPGGGREK
ncbi:MAG: nitrilase-related carbon-nitrogen hydrolase [Acetanaerobacterium sp.]